MIFSKFIRSPHLVILSATAFLAIVFALAKGTNKNNDQLSLQRENTVSVADMRGSLVWAEEFGAPLDLTTSTHIGRWRAANITQNPDVGYKDHSGDSWNINPKQHPLQSPFSVENGVLAISVQKTPKAIEQDVKELLGADKLPEWSGGILISEPRSQTFRYGYFEVRARWPNPGAGMFPAIWLYVADGRSLQDPSKSGAEIDIFEILGSNTGKPWEITLHRRDWLGAGEMTNVGSFMYETSNWHVYGLDWQPDKLRFFRDDILLAEVQGDEAKWFDVDMSIRLNFTVNGSHLKRLGRLTDETTPDAMTMEVDYVRVYKSKGLTQPVQIN